MITRLRPVLIACALLVATATASQAALVRVVRVPHRTTVSVRVGYVAHPYVVHPVRRIYVRSVPVVRTVPVVHFVSRPVPVVVRTVVYPSRVIEVVTHRHRHPTFVYVGRRC